MNALTFNSNTRRYGNAGTRQYIRLYEPSTGVWSYHPARIWCNDESGVFTIDSPRMGAETFDALYPDLDAELYEVGTYELRANQAGALMLLVTHEVEPLPVRVHLARLHSTY